jgi:hypothetical protein
MEEKPEDKVLQECSKKVKKVLERYGCTLVAVVQIKRGQVITAIEIERKPPDVESFTSKDEEAVEA